MTPEAKRKGAGTLPPPPSGGREVTAGGQYNFFNFERAGQVVQGTLAGTCKIRNQRGEERDRYQLLVDKTTHVLPDHLDLMRKLDDVVKISGQLARVWIQYLGKVKIANVANPMAQYRVVDYGSKS